MPGEPRGSALNRSLLYPDAYRLAYRAQKERLDADPDELSFFEKIPFVSGLTAWWLPGRYRIVADARNLAGWYLTGLSRGVGGCDEFGPVLEELAGLATATPDPAGGYLLEYSLREEYESLFTTDDLHFVPPLRWHFVPTEPAQVTCRSCRCAKASDLSALRAPLSVPP